MKRLALYALVVAATLAFLVAVWQFRGVFILLALSLILTAALRPSVDFLAARGLRAVWARAAVYLLVFGGLVIGIYLVSGPLLAELQLLTNYLVILYDSTHSAWTDGTALQQSIMGRLPAPNELDELATGPAGLSFLRLIFGVTQSVASLVGGLVIVIILSLYWSADRNDFERLWLSLLPAGRRIEARAIWQTAEASLGDYLRSEAIQAFLAVIMLVLGYHIIGLDYPWMTALITGISWLIPLAGFLIAGLAAFISGLASAGLVLALEALALTAGVLVFLELVVEPRLFNRRRFSGVLITLAIIILVEAYGMVGFVVAPLIAVAVQVLAEHIIRVIRSPGVTPSVGIDILEQRLAAVNGRFTKTAAAEGEDGQLTPEAANLLARLEDLLSAAREIAVKEP